MLDYIDETNRDKVETNWMHLYSCFNAVKEIYLFLSHHCMTGLENLLIFSSDLKILEVETKPESKNDEI